MLKCKMLKPRQGHACSLETISLTDFPIFFFFTATVKKLWE